MIIDLKKFIAAERPFWDELADLIRRRQQDSYRGMDLVQIRRLYYLYQRASADLAKLQTFSAERDIRAYLESLVARAYALIHAGRQKPVRISPLRWLWHIFPGTFRKHWAAFALAAAVMLAGAVFGGIAVMVDPEAKAVLMPFEHLQMDPAQRVALEEQGGEADRLGNVKGTFAAFLMTHNTRVSVLVLALGMTWGIGTVVVLFSNGVMLGAVAADYLAAGQSTFLFGWLLPHGALEIPAILIAGQSGFLLAGALIGRRSAASLGERLRAVGPDVVHLIGGVALMLVWAGLVESFFSQYHAPVIPYGAKIVFGIVELALVAAYLGFAGRIKRFVTRG
jgi:uncharacterized membrane protein SpoIIM required for sporulation